jgi:hypothetical protein
MTDQHVSDVDQILSLFRGFSQWINIHGPRDGLWSGRAREIDCSFNGLPTLTVELSEPIGLIATYKCNITLLHTGRRVWLMFSPLVVIWAQNREERGPGFGRRIIDHSVSSIEGFCRAHAPHLPDILAASGNLTTVKGGKPFFQGLGWEIVDAQVCGERADDGLNNDGLGRALAHIAAQIDAALAPLRLTAPEAIEPVCFALLRLSQRPVIQQAAHSGEWRATPPAL